MANTAPAVRKVASRIFSRRFIVNAVFAPTRAPIAPVVTSIATLPTPSTPVVMPNQALRSFFASWTACAAFSSDTDV